MSEHLQNFINYLHKLKEKDKAALAIMRRSLGFGPGDYLQAYSYIEKFVGDKHDLDPYRKALYLIAGLFSMHPHHDENVSFASAFGTFAKKSESKSIEHRFVVLLSGESGNIQNYLRHAIALLNKEEIPFDFTRLIGDMSLWFQDRDQERVNELKQRWARDFYRAYDLQEQENKEDIQKSE